jgi:hypothetical protein
MTRRKKMMRTRMTSDWLLVYLDRLQIWHVELVS